MVKKNGTIFFEMSSAPGKDAIDGIKTTSRGICPSPDCGLSLRRPNI